MQIPSCLCGYLGGLLLLQGLERHQRRPKFQSYPIIAHLLDKAGFGPQAAQSSEFLSAAPWQPTC
jgi:hypothetical protein